MGLGFAANKDVTPETYEAVQVLGSFPANLLEELIEVVLRGLEGEAPIPVLLEEYAEAHNVKKMETLTSISNMLEAFFRGSVQHGSSLKVVAEDLKKLGAKDAVIQAVGVLWKEHLPALSHSFAEASLEVNKLEDVEWRFGVAAGSSDKAISGAAFIEMKLKIRQGDESVVRYMELSLPQFYEFVHQMERAKAVLEANSVKQK